MEGRSGEDFDVEEAFARGEFPRPKCVWFYGDEVKVKVAGIYEQRGRIGDGAGVGRGNESLIMDSFLNSFAFLLLHKTQIIKST